jgi:hypothetical protein
MKLFTVCRLLVAGLAPITAQPAGAFTYNDRDVLLIFRADGYDNVEFNLGARWPPPWFPFAVSVPSWEGKSLRAR